MGKRILIVSQYFYPENFRINDFALELKERGFDVTVLTGLPNYPKGEYYEGYDSSKNCDETWKGIKIYRCKCRARKKGFVNLALNYFSFIHQGGKKIKELYNQEFDLIYVMGLSPITVTLPAIKFKHKKKIPLILYVQDLWPESFSAVTGIENPVLIKPLMMLVKYIYSKCDYILAASNSFVEKIKNVSKKGNISFFPQYSLVSKEEKQVELFEKKAFNIVFTGNVGVAQGLDIMLESAFELKTTNIRWHIIGNGSYKEELEKKSKELGLESIVLFHGFVPEKDIPQYLACADASLLILKPDPVFEMTIPAKLQTYMSCGVPVIGCVAGESKFVIEEAKCGLVTKNIDSKSLTEICKQMIKLDDVELKELADNALFYSGKYFDKNKIMNKFETIMEELL